MRLLFPSLVVAALIGIAAACTTFPSVGDTDLFAVPDCPSYPGDLPPSLLKMCSGRIPANAPDPYVPAVALCKMPQAPTDDQIQISAVTCVMSNRLQTPPHGGISWSASFGLLVTRPFDAGPHLENSDGQTPNKQLTPEPLRSPPAAVTVVKMGTTMISPIPLADLKYVTKNILVQVSAGTCATLDTSGGCSPGSDLKTSSILAPVLAPVLP